MFPEAVARYHDLLADQKLADDSATLLNEGLEHAKLIFGGRRLSPYLRPHFVTEIGFRANHNRLRNCLVRDSEGKGCGNY